jgi:hypothetical protein
MTGPPKNANGRLCLTGRVRKTNCEGDPRVSQPISVVKSDALLDFLQRPTFAQFVRAFPNFNALPSGDDPEGPDTNTKSNRR